MALVLHSVMAAFDLLRTLSSSRRYPLGMGTVFQVTTNCTLTTLVSFASTNGAYPQAALTLGNDSNFCGMTGNGGVAGFLITASTFR
jgi:hypothetical protein